LLTPFEKSHNTHFNLEEALDFIALVKPESITHISHLLGFHEEFKTFTSNVFLAFDNLEITL
jgi:phosphoribosyl 1,2-cyclic phosphate phosphodiesterase